ncbi:hypothetical protein E2C01_072732 [Portunus trituberculatus]|uniref:Uncharacterized protein n=1 Tax=Portunus trituberculatus TaxID=210409 RepID=A0A5B7I9Q2_PORTR|nr:hypothetical protein [Portunus trituberculatus]
MQRVRGTCLKIAREAVFISGCSLAVTSVTPSLLRSTPSLLHRHTASRYAIVPPLLAPIVSFH